MTGNSSPPYQPNILRTPDKKPIDFRATTQQQSNAGTYDERGGDTKVKKIVTWTVVTVLVALVVTLVIDAVAGRGFL